MYDVMRHNESNLTYLSKNSFLQRTNYVHVPYILQHSYSEKIMN